MTARKYSRRSVLRTAAFLAGGTAAVPLIQACAPVPAPTLAPGGGDEPVPEAGGGTLVIGNTPSSKTEEFDMQQVFELQTMIFANCVHENLVLFDYRDLTPKPRLAESWEVAPDLKSVVFRLRKGVKFHSGTPFNADAVVYSFDRIYDENHPRYGDAIFYYTSWIPFYEGVEKIDDFTVKFTFSEPDVLILQRFALWVSSIVDPVALEEAGSRDYSLDPTKFSGTGPYKAVELRQDEIAVLERNEDWWGSPKPDFQKLIFRLILDDDARVNALLAREVDVALYMPGDRRKDLEDATAQGLEVEWFPQTVLGYYYINHTLPFFQDKRVRQAIARSFDRETFYEATAGPTTIPQGGFWYPDSPFFNPEAEVNFNPVLAKSLLEEAGFTEIGSDGIRVRPSDGLRAEFVFNWSGAPGQAPNDDLVFWSQQLKELLQVDAPLEASDPGLSHDFEKGPLTAENLGISSFGVGTFLGDPEFALDRWTCAQRVPDGFNASQYCSEEMDALYQASRGESDLQKRADIFNQMQALAAEDIPWIPSSIATMGAAWWPDKVSDVTAGHIQSTFPWTYKLPKA